MDQWVNQPQIPEEELKFEEVAVPQEEVKDKDPDKIFKSTGFFPAEDVDKRLSQMGGAPAV